MHPAGPCAVQLQEGDLQQVLRLARVANELTEVPKQHSCKGPVQLFERRQVSVGVAVHGGVHAVLRPPERVAIRCNTHENHLVCFSDALYGPAAFRFLGKRELGSVHVLFQRCSEPRASPVEQDPLIGCADLQNAADLVRAQSLDVAEDDDHALRFG